MSDDESFEAELRGWLRPAAPPDALARRLAQTVAAAPPAQTRPAPVPGRRRWSWDASSFLRGLAWSAGPLTAAVALTLWLRAPKQPPKGERSGPSSLTVDSIDLEREVLKQSDGGIVELPDSQVVRLVQSDGIERVTLTDTRTGAVIERTMSTTQIIPVRLQIY